MPGVPVSGVPVSGCAGVPACRLSCSHREMFPQTASPTVAPAIAVDVPVDGSKDARSVSEPLPILRPDRNRSVALHVRVFQERGHRLRRIHRAGIRRLLHRDGAARMQPSCRRPP